MTAQVGFLSLVVPADVYPWDLGLTLKVVFGYGYFFFQDIGVDVDTAKNQRREDTRFNENIFPHSVFVSISYQTNPL